jgi:hypothetical protein
MSGRLTRTAELPNTPAARVLPETPLPVMTYKSSPHNTGAAPDCLRRPQDTRSRNLLGKQQFLTLVRDPGK